MKKPLPISVAPSRIFIYVNHLMRRSGNFFVGASASLAAAVSATAEVPDFRERIQPILEENCVRCHNAEKTKGDLRMDTYEALMEGGSSAEAVVPGDPEASELLVRIHLRPIDEDFMPEEGRPLEPEQVDLLDAWVRGGAPWPEGVTLTERKPAPVERVALPETAPASAAEAAAMLDDILRRQNADKDLVVAAPIDDIAFLRRATIDLVGRIPTIEEIREYESWDGDRRAKLVDKWLSHPRFADRWTVFMADMLRIRTGLPGGGSLLRYVRESLDRGRPYDVLVRELIAASGRADANPAVGYILGEDADPMELAASTSQVFLGVRMGCAMCHDHPFDDWRQRDFYHFAAFFGKTRQVGDRRRGMLYATEGETMNVLWPPEDRADGGDREPVRPRFPIDLVDSGEPPEYVRRFEAKRRAEASASEDDGAAALDALLDAAGDGLADGPEDAVLEEAKRESRRLDVHGDLYRASELRAELAELVANPRNDFFARAFVNRLWAELIGRGFVEPLDNFSPYADLRHASALDFLAREFVAGGYDIRHLVRIIALSDAYRRGPAPAGLPLTRREASERNFAAAPTRRMLSEVLYDSIVTAGHLGEPKWPPGANAREITREIRVPVETDPAMAAADGEAAAEAMETPAAAAARAEGYDLESSLALDFDSGLSAAEQAELRSMRAASDERIEAEKMAAMRREARRDRTRYTTETVTETVDDNPRFDSAMRMATPAPPAHFLRVFGQPSRASLGEFRDASSSLRQQLMMLNGRMTHEASRVGPLEPIHRLLDRDPEAAIELAYREILTRLPSPAEKAEAFALLDGDPRQGMADLRWALLNCHEFRFLP